MRELEGRYAAGRRGGVHRPETKHGIEFPESAWTGLFGHWLDVIRPCTEAAVEKLWVIMVMTVGLALGRNVWVVNPQKVYPNFYALLIGQTANARKSTVLWLATELLCRIDKNVQIIRGAVSTEGIYECLSKERCTRALGYADEFRSLLAVAKRQGTADILPKLNSLYSCPNEDKITRRDRSTEIKEPFFSLLSATPLQYVEKLLTNEDIAGGVLNRYLIVSGKEQPPKPIPRPPSEAAWESVAGPVRDIANHWRNTPHEFELVPEAIDLWCEFYVSWRKTMDDWDPREADLTNRIFEHVLKIALVYSVIFNETRITAKALAIAISIGKWLQASTLSIFSDVGLDSLTKLEREIVNVVEKRPYVYRRDLQRHLSRKAGNGEFFSRALRALEANGFIKCHDGSLLTPLGAYLGGQVRPWIEYIRADN